MKTKLRLVGGLTAALIFAGGLSACSDDEATTDTETTTAPAAETETTVAATETSTS